MGKTTIEAAAAPAAELDPCVLTPAEVESAIGMLPPTAGEGDPSSCLYLVNSEAGAVRFEIKVKPWVTDRSVFEAVKESYESRVAIEDSKVGKGLLTFKPSLHDTDLPAYLLTSKGLVNVILYPAGPPTEADAKLVVKLAKAVDKKLASQPDPVADPKRSPVNTAP